MIKDYGFFDHDYPYTNFHELNLDWILMQMLKLRSDMRNFVNQNTIKYADPIQWNIATQYEGNTVVIEPNSGNAYISSQPVPAGVAISNEDYWSVIGNFSVLYESIKESIAAADDGSNINATEARAEGSLLWLNSKLYKVLSDISVGALYITSGTGQNLEEVTIEELLHNIDGQIVEINNTITEIQEKLDNPTYTDVKSYGAVGDGVTDDTQAFIDAFSENDNIIITEGSYKISGSITLHDNMDIQGVAGSIIINNIDPDTEERYPAIFKASGKTNINMCGVHIKGSAESITQGGGINLNDINFEDCDNINIHHCSFIYSNTNYVIRIANSSNVVIDSIYINHFHYIGVSFSIPCRHCKLVNSIIKNADNIAYNAQGQTYHVDANGFEHELTDSDPLNDDILIQGNTLMNDDGNDGTWEALNAHGGNNITIDSNYVYNTYSGIACDDSPSRHYRQKNCHITNNTIILTFTNRTNTVKNNLGICIGGQHCIVANNIVMYGGYAGSLHENFDDPAAILIISANGVDFINNRIFGSRGNVFEFKLDCQNVNVRNNYIQGLYWETPYGALKACVFNLHNASLLNLITIEDNKINGYENNDWLIYGKTGSTPEAYGNVNSYVKVIKNEEMTSRALVLSSADNIVCDKQSSISNVKMGHIGDVILKDNNTTGQPIGWICSKKWVNGASGIWSTLSNA